MNKHIKIMLTSVIAVMLILTVAIANDKEKTVKIKTSSQCNECKERIEKHLAKQDGIIEATLDVPTAVCTVKYDSTEISVDDIREEIASVGYDADDVKASKRAYKKLPKCCQKPEDQK